MDERYEVMIKSKDGSLSHSYDFAARNTAAAVADAFVANGFVVELRAYDPHAEDGSAA